MKHKDISKFEYAFILIVVAVITVACITGIFMAGSGAAVKVFNLPPWAGLVIFGILMLIWNLNGRFGKKSRKGKK